MKKRYVFVAVAVLTIGGSWFGWYWTTFGRFIERTDNAYIRSEITQISSKVSGCVSKVPAEDNTPVAAGDALVRIEDLEFKVRFEHSLRKLEERKAALNVAQNKSRLQQTRIAGCQANLESAQAEQMRRHSELTRYKALFPKGIVSELDYETVITLEKKTRAETMAALANLDAAKKEREVLLAEESRIEAEIHQQEEETKLQAKELSDTVILAPIAGVIGNRRVRVGQYVRPGTLLLAVIPTNDIWVEANFKEIQLARMREGQPVSIEVDAFSGQTLTGRLASLSPASGAEYSLIPPENASGNFTKVVQRVPVRIHFEPGQPLLKSLRSGMSVVVKLDTRSDTVDRSKLTRLAPR
jgi:membrane fusion protein, multidrug efflux system